MEKELSSSLCHLKYKVVFLGDTGVGKTSIIQSFVKDAYDSSSRVPPPSYQPTVGIDFLPATSPSAVPSSKADQTVEMQLSDIAGHEKFKSLVPTYLRDAHCAFFVFTSAGRSPSTTSGADCNCTANTAPRLYRGACRQAVRSSIPGVGRLSTGSEAVRREGEGHTDGDVCKKCNERAGGFLVGDGQTDGLVEGREAKGRRGVGREGARLLPEV